MEVEGLAGDAEIRSWAELGRVAVIVALIFIGLDTEDPFATISGIPETGGILISFCVETEEALTELFFIELLLAELPIIELLLAELVLAELLLAELPIIELLLAELLLTELLLAELLIADAEGS